MAYLADVLMGKPLLRRLAVSCRGRLRNTTYNNAIREIMGMLQLMAETFALTAFVCLKAIEEVGSVTL